MNNMSNGVISRGIKAPMIKEGDDLVNIIVDSVINEVNFPFSIALNLFNIAFILINIAIVVVLGSLLLQASVS